MTKQFKNFIEVLDYYKDEATCLNQLEKQRWGDTVICPHCGHNKVYRTNRGFKCASNKCHKKFSATVGTIFENSKIPLRIWFAAIYLCTAHKKGISSLQLGRDLGITQKSAWFVLHRVRAMLQDFAPTMLKGTVEVDETYVGGKRANKHKWERVELSKNGDGYVDKQPVFSLVHRESGTVRNFVVDKADGVTLKPIIYNEVEKGSIIMSDTFGAYYGLNRTYQHETLNHKQDEYVRGIYHTNTVEGYFSILKRGIIGIYHYVSPKHLHRYCNEFEYRYNTRKVSDAIRFDESIKRVGNIRLKYNDLIKD